MQLQYDGKAIFKPRLTLPFLGLRNAKWLLWVQGNPQSIRWPKGR